MSQDSPIIRVSVPKSATAGEVIELKAMIRHKMETGYRRDPYGKQIPRFILKFFECRYNGEPVFRSEFFPGVAADPFLGFFVRATVSGELVFEWTDQAGAVFSKAARLEVL